MATAKKKKNPNSFRYVLLVIIALLVFAVFRVFGPNTGAFTNGTYLYIHTGSDYEKVIASLEHGGFISDMWSFELLAKWAKLSEHIHPGKYKINNGMSNYRLIRLLHSGKQTEVKLTINKLRTVQDFVHLLSTNLEADSMELRQHFHDNEYLSQFGLDSNTMMCAVIPDTYVFYWNTNADKAFKKIERNREKFWDETRKQQAQAQGLTPVKAAIIASIVDEESNMMDDKPKIASVYINRLHKDMKLQADPTVKFAIGDFTIRRVTGPMLQTNSPYNTYMYEGLPPGPICTPSPGSIDAVLMAPKTTYLYFCAKDDFSGYSAFATTFAEQMKNAHAYQKALDARGIH